MLGVIPTDEKNYSPYWKSINVFQPTASAVYFLEKLSEILLHWA